MTNRDSADTALGACASCIVLIVGGAFVALLYGLITAAVPLVELVMLQRMLMTTGF